MHAIPQRKEKKENCADRIISFLLHDRHLSFSLFFHWGILSFTVNQKKEKETIICQPHVFSYLLVADDRFSLSFLCWPCEGKTWAVKTILFPFIHCGPLIEKERERPTMLRWNERNSFSNPLMHFFLYSDSHLTESSLPPRTIKRKDKRLFVEEMVDGCQYEKKWIPCG